MLLPEAHVATIKEFTLRFDAEKRDVSEPFVEAFHLPPGQYKLRCKWNDAHPDVAHEGEWAGELVNETLKCTTRASGDTQEMLLFAMKLKKNAKGELNFKIFHC
jgi:hypothetical protein